VSEITNIAADVKAGRQRAASHSMTGKNSSTGTICHHSSGSRKMMAPDAHRVGREPMPPGAQDWHFRTVEELVRQGPAYPRDGGSDDRRSQENHDMSQPRDGEISTDVTPDQPGDEQGFPRIAEGESARGPGGSVAREIGNDGGRNDTDDHGPLRDGDWPPRIASKADQDA
jgi:hypothetical protein